MCLLLIIDGVEQQKTKKEERERRNEHQVRLRGIFVFLTQTPHKVQVV
jgi:hypothetical protein